MQNATLSPFDRLTVLDGLRGFAILLVIWYHLLLVSGYGLPYFGAVEILGRNGFLGVDLFFFVSGFCMIVSIVWDKRYNTYWRT
jgi:peptidoglycan/LPS O-acetylase OafA/YrhL